MASTPPKATARLFIQAIALVAAVGYITTLFASEEPHHDRRQLTGQIIDPKTVNLRPSNSSPSQPSISAVLTSWYTFQSDPQRPIQVEPNDIEYIYNLYTTATHYEVPLVVFHDGLTEEFVQKYTNQYVSFELATPDPQFSTNDFRFFPYLEYIKSNKLDSVLMVDASDVHFNSNPFYYMNHYKHDQLFMSLDGARFQWRSWMVPQCYGESAHSWPKKYTPMYNAGVFGGNGPSVQCLLECVTDQLHQLLGKGNCNMAAVNYCANFGPCGDVHDAAPTVVHQSESSSSSSPSLVSFVNPFRSGCRDTQYAVVHNKCPDTEYATRVTIDEKTNQVVLIAEDGGMSAAGAAAMALEERRRERRRKRAGVKVKVDK